MGILGDAWDATGGAIIGGLSGGEGHAPSQYAFDDTEVARQRKAQEEARGYQTALADRFDARARGADGPSVAESQLQQGLNAAQAAQWAQSQSATGSAAARGAAQYNAARSAANIQQQGAASAATLRAQEQMGYEQQLAGLYGDIRQGDQGQFAGEAGYQGTKAGEHGATERAWAQQAESAAGRRGDVWSGLMESASQAGAMMAMGGGSDERLKEVGGKATDADLQEFLEAAKAHWYQYREGTPDADGGKTHVGPMAQDLEKTKVGRTMVDRRPDGMRQVDLWDSYGAMLASLGSLNERLGKLEGGK